jgi:hypothetical protein
MIADTCKSGSISRISGIGFDLWLCSRVPAADAKVSQVLCSEFSYMDWSDMQGC